MGVCSKIGGMTGNHLLSQLLFRQAGAIINWLLLLWLPLPSISSIIRPLLFLIHDAVVPAAVVMWWPPHKGGWGVIVSDRKASWSMWFKEPATNRSRTTSPVQHPRPG